MKTKTIPKDFFKKDDSSQYLLVEEGEFGVFFKKDKYDIYTDANGVFWRQKTTSYYDDDTATCCVGTEVDDTLVQVERIWKVVE